MLPAPTIDKNLFENRNKTNISKHSKHQVCARVLFKFQNDCVNCGRIILFPLLEFLSLHCQFNLLYTAQEISAISNYRRGGYVQSKIGADNRSAVNQFWIFYQIQTLAKKIWTRQANF